MSQVKKISKLLLAFVVEIALLLSFLVVVPTQAVSAAPLSSGNKVLVFGDSDNGSERTNAAATLSALGYDVSQADSLSENLTQYASIWNVAAYSELTEGDIVKLVDYSSSGGNLYLTGERPCCESLNQSVQRLLRQVLRNESVTVGRGGDVNGPFTFNPDVVGNLSKFPNRLLDFVPDSPGAVAGIGNIGARNVFASSSTTAVAAAWDESDKKSGNGRVVLMMDIDYLQSGNRAPIMQNIATFLNESGRCQAGGGNSSIQWDKMAPENCSILPTAENVRFVARSAVGQLEMEITQDGIPVECSAENPRSADQTCWFTLQENQTSANIQVRAFSAAAGESVLNFRLVPKNDNRNVPEGSPRNDHWWQFPDEDKDGIPDKWERDGVWVNGTYLNLPAMGANPKRKDLFVYAESEAGYRLDEEVFQNVKDAFEKAPFLNPDGSRGVSVHFTRGQQNVPSSIADSFRGEKASLSADAVQRAITYTGYGSRPERGGGGVPPLFKWMLNINKSSANNTIGMAYIKGSYGWTAAEGRLWDGRNYQNLNQSAKNTVRATNFAHELGHQLGLDHSYGEHGKEDDPTYLSVMSYAWSVFGIDYRVVNKNWPWEKEYVDSGRIDFGRINDRVNFDWELGRSKGKLTFVPGQHGEIVDFYSQSLNNVIAAEDAIVGDDGDSADRASREWTPESYSSFAEEHGFANVLEFPSIEAPEAVVVNAGETIRIPLTGNSPSGQALLAEVKNLPLLGQIGIDGDTILYKALGPGSGEEKLLVRLSDGNLGSDYAVLTITVRSGAGESGSSGGGSTDEAGSLGSLFGGSSS